MNLPSVDLVQAAALAVARAAGLAVDQAAGPAAEPTAGPMMAHGDAQQLIYKRVGEEPKHCKSVRCMAAAYMKEEGLDPQQPQEQSDASRRQQQQHQAAKSTVWIMINIKCRYWVQGTRCQVLGTRYSVLGT